jgi:uncharacterized membrane protein
MSEDKNGLEDQNNSDNQRIITWSQQKTWSKALSILLILAILGCIGATIYIINAGHSSDPFSEFYILGKDGKANNYPSVVKAGEETEIKLGIINHEYNQTTYMITISMNGTDLQKLEPITLDVGQKWEELVKFTVVQNGAKQKIDFFLFRQNDTVPYLKLNLIMNVNQMNINSN